MKEADQREDRNYHSSRLIDRRTVSIGIAALVGSNSDSIAGAAAQTAGCAHLQAMCSFAERGADTFPGLKRMTSNSDLALGAIGIELSMLLQVTASPALYDDSDSGSGGNAGASFNPLFPTLPGVPPTDGGVVFGTKCYASLQGQSAAIAAVYAHELGHLLQKKFVSTQLYNLRNQDRSVARAELHADFVCGYYAAFRKQRQSDWAVVIQKNLEFKFGDYQFANPLHHGTPAERQAAVEAGFQFGSSGLRTPSEVANSGLEYVRSLVLDRRSQPQSC